MNKVLKLTKIFLKNSFSNMDAKMGVTSKNSKNKFILYGILFLYLAVLVTFFSYNLINGLITINQQTVFIGIILFIVFGVVIAQSILSSINILYFTKDSEYLLPLPLKPYQIILARTNVMLVVQFLIIALVGLLPLVIYGILTNASISYYILMLISVLLLPILPVLLICILVMIIMSFARLTKNKNKFQVLAYILLLVIVVVFSISISSVKGDISNEEMAQMIVQANGMIEIAKGYFPTLDFLINALTTSSLVVAIIEILKTIGITIVGFLIYMFIAQKIYFKGLVGNLFSSDSKNKNKEVNQKKYINSKLYRSYVGKEFKNLVRNPIFLMQCLLPAILIPVLMMGVVYSGMSSQSEDMSQITQITSMMETNTFFMACIILCVIQFFSMFIYISITAISREGENAVFMKYIPVSLYKQYIYKCIPNIIMNVVTIVICLAVAQYLLKLPIITIILLFIVATVIGTLQSIVMIIIDLKRPKLSWDSEYAVVKQNFNLIFPMIIGMINIAVLIFMVFLFKNINVYIGLFILGIIYTVAVFLTNKYLYKNQFKLADKIM